MTTVTVLGGHGQVGTLLIAELAARHFDVRAVTRTGPVVANLTDLGQTCAAAAGSDVLFHVAGAPYAEWPTRLPALMSAALGAARASGAVLVYLDNLYAYGPSAGPLTPATPMRPSGALGRVRAALVDQLDAASDVRSVVVRVSDFYGAGRVRSTPGTLVLDRVAAGRTGQWPYRADQPHALHYLPDVARGLAVIGTDDRAVGHVYHLPAAPAPTGAEFVGLSAHAFGRPARVSVLGAPLLRLAAVVNADARDLRSLAYQYTAPFLVDADATSAVFGDSVAPTGHEAALDAIAAAAAR